MAQVLPSPVRSCCGNLPFDLPPPDWTAGKARTRPCSNLSTGTASRNAGNMLLPRHFSCLRSPTRLESFEEFESPSEKVTVSVFGDFRTETTSGIQASVD